MLYAIFAVLVIILDQGVKYWVSGAVRVGGESLVFIPDILSIVNVHNEGAAFGFLANSNARLPFIILTGVFTLAVILMLATKFISGPLARWSIVLVTAGGLSNCIDRVIYGYVQDMFKCEFVNFPVFNVADIFITVFALLFVLAILFERDRRKEDYDFDDDEYEEDEAEEDEEEEEAPAPKRRLSRREKRAAARRAREEEEEDDDEEEEEEEPPVRRAPQRRPAPRKASRYDEEDDEDEEEEKPAPRRSAPVREEPAPRRSAPAREEPAPKRTSKYDAEFETARARRQANAATPRPAPAREEESPAKRYEVPAPAVNLDLLDKPEPKRREAPPSAPAPAEKAEPETMGFSLDDILAEFK